MYTKEKLEVIIHMIGDIQDQATSIMPNTLPTTDLFITLIEANAELLRAEKKFTKVLKICEEYSENE